MKVEIWSDVACPFCYIGKKRFEKALDRFAQKEKIEVEWKSYQLDPSLPATASESLPEYLARQKGMSLADVGRMFENVTQMASEEGIEMHMDRVKAANTATMHRLIQLAKTRGMGAKAEEKFFEAYFAGKDFTNEQVLLEIAGAVGLELTKRRLSLFITRPTRKKWPAIYTRHGRSVFRAYPSLCLTTNTRFQVRNTPILFWERWRGLFRNGKKPPDRHN